MDFRNFLVQFLKRGKVRDAYVEKLLTPENLEEFRVAFTHPSYDAKKNYQLYEFLGDSVINEFVPFYLRWRFPRIVSVKWVTRLKHTLISGRYLAKIVRKEGIDAYAIYGDLPFTSSAGRSFVGMNKEIDMNPDLDNNAHYLNMLEDIMEAFFGCLTTIIVDAGQPHGVATEISHNILRSLFGPAEIPHRFEDVFDPVSRLKELYESRARGYKWPNDQSYKFEKFEYPDGSVKFQTIVYGWPKGDKTVKQENKVELAREIALTKPDSKEKAARRALQVLDLTWGIKETQLDPYEK